MILSTIKVVIKLASILSYLVISVLIAQDESSYHPLGEWIPSKITSDFGRRSFGRNHNGIDIDGNIGDNVYAWRSGYVVNAGYSSSKGNFIRIRHEGNLITKYFHLSRVYVKKDDYVNGGQIIGEVGNTGRVVKSIRGDGSHLHFEIHLNGKPQNPRPILVNSKSVPKQGTFYRTVKFNSNPSDIKIYINDEYLGKTPIQTTLKQGEYRVRLEGNRIYKNLFKNILISETSESIYNFHLQPNSKIAERRIDRNKEDRKQRFQKKQVYGPKDIILNGLSFHYGELSSDNIIYKNIVNDVQSYQFGLTFIRSSEIANSIYWGYQITISAFGFSSKFNEDLSYYRFASKNSKNILHDELKKINLLACSIGYYRTLGFSEVFHIIAGGNILYGYYHVEGKTQYDDGISKEMKHKIEYFQAAAEIGVSLKFGKVLFSGSYYKNVYNIEPKLEGIRFGIIIDPSRK